MTFPIQEEQQGDDYDMVFMDSYSWENPTNAYGDLLRPFVPLYREDTNAVRQRQIAEWVVEAIRRASLQTIPVAQTHVKVQRTGAVNRILATLESVANNNNNNNKNNNTTPMALETWEEAQARPPSTEITQELLLHIKANGRREVECLRRTLRDVEQDYNDRIASFSDNPAAANPSEEADLDALEKRMLSIQDRILRQRLFMEKLGEDVSLPDHDDDEDYFDDED